MRRHAVLVALALLASVVPGAAQDILFAPPPAPVATDQQLLRKYVWSTLGLDGAIHATLASGLDQIRGEPTEWGDGADGYARRWASDYAESAIADTTKYAIARMFNHDPSFTRCECDGIARRLGHAIDAPFMSRTRNGKRVLSAASLAGILAGSVVPAATWYPAPLGTRDGLKHAATSLISKIAVDVFKEFRPHRSK